MLKRTALLLVVCSLVLASLACGIGGNAEPDQEQAPPAENAQGDNGAEAVPVEEPTPTEEPVAEPVSPFIGPAHEGAQSRIGRGSAKSMAISSDGQFLAIGSSLGIYLYRTDTLEDVWFAPATSEISFLNFTEDGSKLVGMQFTRVMVWDAATGNPIGEPMQNGRTPYAVAVSPDGTLAAVSANEIINIWDLNNHQMIAELEGHTEYVWTLAWSPDGSQLLSGSDDEASDSGVIFVWDVESGAIVEQFGQEHTSNLLELYFSADGSKLLSASSYEQLVWDYASKTILSTVNRSMIKSAALSPDGAQAAYGFGDGSTVVFDAATGTELYTTEGQTSPIYELGYSSATGNLYTMSATGSIFERAAASGEMLRLIEGFTLGYGTIVWSPDGATLWGGISSSQVIHWDPSAFEILHLYDDFGAGALFGSSAVQAIVYSPDNSLLAFGHPDGRVSIYDPATDTLVKTFGDRETGHKNSVAGLDWSADGARIITASGDKTVILWDVEAGAPLVHFTDFSDSPFNDIVLLEGDTIAFAVTQHGDIYRFDLTAETAELAWYPDQGIIYDMAKHPAQASQFATANSNGNVVIWNATTGEAVLTLEEPLWHASAVAFSPDGTVIAGGDTDGNIAWWDAATGELLGTFERAHNNLVSRIAFSPDGLMFASVAGDGVILLWSVK